jgi:hypothetical protein
MRSLGFLIAALMAVLCVSGGVQAATPVWQQSGKSADNPVELLDTRTQDSTGHEVVCSDVVSGGLAEPLIQVSCTNDTVGYGNTGDFLSASGCGQTWVKFTPYAWATMIDGNATIHGFTAPVNLDLGDLWSLLENGDIRGAFMGHLEFGRDNWAMFFNGDIVSADPSVEVRRANIDTGVTMTLLEMGGAVDLFNANESDPVHSPLRLQLLGGVRYYSVSTSAILSLPHIIPVVQDAQAEDWVDLFVGLRAMAQLTPSVNAFVRGDIGGFGIGTSSDHAWNFVTGITTDSIWGSNLVLGYRVFDLDQSLHGGTGSPQGFGFDAVMHGPVVGLTFQF